ncbi:MAG: hypothetical protein QOK10_2640 [Pseudonocardiales bacterium]|jgi:hypothetical protein|nr:hypothetical protein [Pseudonocardiales bacterium]
MYRPLGCLLAVTAVLATSLISAIGPASSASAVVTTAFAASGPPAVPVSGLLFGASVSSAPGQSAAQSLAAEEARLGRGLALDRSYSRWDDAQPNWQVADDGAHGRVPLVGISPRRKDGSLISWLSIAAGGHDTEIRKQADGLRDTGVPMIVSFHHEADIATGYGTAAQFVAAFRHYVSVFRAEQATNVAFAVVLVPITYANPAAWYPGDDVVDWIGTDAYNFAACSPGRPAWRSLSTVAGNFYRWGSTRGKPLLLAEWGSAEDPTQPGRKAAWLNDVASTLAGWPQIKAAAYFDRTGSCDWRLSTSVSALAAFQTLAHSALANGGPTARMVASTAVGPAPLDETFTLDTSTGSGSSTGTGVTSWTLDFGDGSARLTGVGQPSTVGHAYSAGHWTATLTVLDALGRTATTTVKGIAASAPVIATGSPCGVSPTTAVLRAWVSTRQLAGTYRLQWGLSASYGSQSAAAPLAALDYSQAVTLRVSGLRASTRYHWRIVATTAAGTTFGPDRWFNTTAL